MVVTMINLSLLLFVLLCSVQQTMGTEVFTILWKYPNIPSNSPIVAQCGPAFQLIRDSLYKTFVLEVVAETNITLSQVTTLDPDWNVTNTTQPLAQRQLLDNSVVKDAGSNHVQQPQQQRLLKGGYKGAVCKINLCFDDAYVIRLAGCNSWCHRNGRLRNLRGEQRKLDSSDDSSDDLDDNKPSPVQQPVPQPVQQPVQQYAGPSICGDRRNIKWNNPGAQTAYDVYYRIEQLPLSDPCRSQMLSLKYILVFVDSSILKDRISCRLIHMKM